MVYFVLYSYVTKNKIAVRSVVILADLLLNLAGFLTVSCKFSI